MTRKPAPSDLMDKFMLRMPDGMRDRIAVEAKKSGRSMNSEIVYRLEQSFEGAITPDLSQLLEAAVSAAVNAAVSDVLEKLESGGIPMEEVVRALKQEARKD